MSRNWPIVTSRRIVAYSARAAAQRGADAVGQALFEQVVAPRDEQIAEQDRRPSGRTRRRRRPIRARGARPRARGARRGVRGACRSCRSRRRGRAPPHGRSRVRRPTAMTSGGGAVGASGDVLHCPPPGEAETSAQALSAVQSVAPALDEERRLRGRYRPLQRRWAERNMSRRWETASIGIRGG